MRLAHCSDLHLLSHDGARWLELANKRWIGAMNLLSNRSRHYHVQAFDDMVDDPYRSLAASVEAEGGFSKPDEPFYEFLWANHLRGLIKASRLEQDYAHTVRKACEIAHASKSRHLPGWSGVRD